jgi:chromosome segregation ATPase
MDNKNDKKNKIEKFKKEIIECYQKIDELENTLSKQNNNYNELFSKDKMLENDIANKNNLITELDDKIFNINLQYQKDLTIKDKIIDDLKIKLNDNKIILTQKNDLLFQLENKLCNLQSEIKKIETQTTLKNKKIIKKDLLIPLLETNDDEKIVLKNELTKSEERIKELEEYIIKIENDFKIYIEKEKEKEKINRITLEDELYIYEKENKLNNIKKELKKLYEEKKNLDIEIFELKSVVQILKENDDVGINVKKKFCCFM